MSLLRSRLIAAAVAALAPFAVAAADPRGDVTACRPGDGIVRGSPPDLVAATARAVEGGAALEARLTFARRPRVPDGDGRPFRVDVVVRDPALPAYSVGPYRHMNRIVRYDAVQAPQLEILLIPERGENAFFAVDWRRRTLVMRLPGRLLTADEDLAGPNLRRLRWSALVRDGDACDRLGQPRPHLRIRGATQPFPLDAGPSIPTSTDPPPGGRGVRSQRHGAVWAAAAAIALSAVVGLVWRLLGSRRRGEGTGQVGG